MSRVDALIESLAAQAHAEIRRMANEARESLKVRAAFHNRSRAQLARWMRAKALQKRMA